MDYLNLVAETLQLAFVTVGLSLTLEVSCQTWHIPSSWLYPSTFRQARQVESTCHLAVYQPGPTWILVQAQRIDFFRLEITIVSLSKIWWHKIPGCMNPVRSNLEVWCNQLNRSYYNYHRWVCLKIEYHYGLENLYFPTAPEIAANRRMFGHGSAWLFGDCVGVPVDRVRGVMGVLGLDCQHRKLTGNSRQIATVPG